MYHRVQMNFKNIIILLLSLCFNLASLSIVSAQKTNQDSANVMLNIALQNFEKAKNDNLATDKLLEIGIESATTVLSYKKYELTDSILQYCLNKSDNKTNTAYKAKLLFLIGKLRIEKNNHDKAMDYLTQALDLALSTDQNELYGNILNNIGVSYWHQRNYPKALDYFDKALDVGEKYMIEDLRLKALTNKGIVYSQFANYSKAIECLLFANELAFKSGNKDIEASSLNSLGNIYIETNQLDKALQSYENSKAIFEQLNDSSGISICLNNIGEIYLKNSNTALALDNYFSSLSIQEARKDTIKIATIYLNIGNTHYKSSQFRYAVKYYQSALTLLLNKQDKSLEAAIKYHLGLTLLATSNFSQSIAYLNDALTSAKVLGERELQSKCLLTLSEVFEKQGDYKKALLYKNDYAVLKDSILNINTIEYMARMEAIYRSIKKEEIIHNLMSEKHIQDQKLIRETNTKKILLITSLFLTILTIILFSAFYFIRKSNRKMTAVNNKLQQLNATKDKFFSIISHDLKSPINSILGFSEMLVLHAESNNTKNLLEYGQMVHSSSKKLFALVDNLLLWSRTQVGSTKYKPEKLDISIQCTNIISLLRLNSEEKDILISGKIEKDLMAYADINLFNTILRNLISNAIKFSRVGGTIIVSAKKVGKEIEISVADSGVGISSENLEKLFKIDSNITTRGTFNEKGSGLGLILCKEFVEINKGTIWAESELERGSTFFFTVPLAQ